MAKTPTLIARWNGEIVGSRTSDRPYIHAIIGHRDEAAARAYAYDYAGTKSDRSNFDFYSWKAHGAPGSNCPGGGYRYPHDFGADEVARAQAQVEGGFEAYIERIRQNAIDSFERARQGGAFRPHVLAWSMSDRAAQQALNSWRKTHVVLGLAPAEPKA